LKNKIINFFGDIVKEMKKVTWPKREELKESTTVVIITSLIFAVFVYIIDKIITEGLKVIF
jgi:preprotein translocase subunit SecE